MSVQPFSRNTPLPANEFSRTSPYGAPTRDTVNSIVDGLVCDICGKIADLRRALDDIEQQVLEGAAGTKHLNDEINHIRGAVDEIVATVLPGK